MRVMGSTCMLNVVLLATVADCIVEARHCSLPERCALSDPITVTLTNAVTDHLPLPSDPAYFRQLTTASNAKALAENWVLRFNHLKRLYKLLIRYFEYVQEPQLLPSSLTRPRIMQRRPSLLHSKLACAESSAHRQGR